MTKGWVVSAVVVCAVCLANDGVLGQSQRGSGVTGASTTSSSSRSTASATDREFINDMVIAGNAEVQLGQLTNEHAASEEVKSFGQMMIKDHTQAAMELMEIASQLNVQPPAQPDAKHKDLVATLSKLQGAEFDRQYMAAMVKGHRDVVDALRVRAGIPDQTTTSALPDTPPTGDGAGVRAANSGGERASTSSSNGVAAVGTSGTSDGAPALTQWAATTLPIVQQHLARAEEIQKALK
jgi:putative membrane protein